MVRTGERMAGEEGLMPSLVQSQEWKAFCFLILARVYVYLKAEHSKH